MAKYKKLKTIKVHKNQFIGCGVFADVFRYSPNRVVKVFNQFVPDHCEPDPVELEYSKRDVEEEVALEIYGSRLSKRCLPCLRVVRVKISGYKNKKRNGLFLGIVKKYLPYKATKEEIRSLAKHFCKYKRLRILETDVWKSNVRKDSNGNVFLIDTRPIP